jgi:hypothetical protein
MKSLIFKIPEAIGSSLDEFHLAVESFGDPVVSRETPHAWVYTKAVVFSCKGKMGIR